jgi:putative pyruvate formate lyase activating enzyme
MEPSYLSLWESGALRDRAEKVRSLSTPCRLCPRECGVDRLSGQSGFCGQGPQARVARALPHFGEEPPLTGKGGAGTIFFTGCALRCLYCQNFQISQEGLGEKVSSAALADMFLDLQRRGCHNLDLVSPTPHWPAILEALELAIPQGLRLPIVYNTHGYVSPELLRCLEGIVDIYLPDMKYGTDESARAFSQVKDYTCRNRAAVREMYRQTGPLQTDSHRIAFRGLLVRHLVLSGGLSGTAEVLQELLEISPRIPLSLMSQYRPCHRASGHPMIGRPLIEDEYRRALEIAEQLGFEEIFIQELESAEAYYPDFKQKNPFQSKKNKDTERTMSEKAPIFEETLRNYLAQVAQIDPAGIAETLAISVARDEAVIHFLGKTYRVSPAGVQDESGKEPLHAVSIVLCRYLILAPSEFPRGGEDWVSYKDFKDAAPFVGGFVNNSERALARYFSGRLDQLRKAAADLGAVPPPLELAYQFAGLLQALPRIPLLLLFNDEDEDFPAQCTLLFQRRAEKFLDMECLAIIGWLLADSLAEKAGLAGRTVM